MSHRIALGVMSPLNRFSILPYLIDPMLENTAIPAGPWNLRHQQAHNDALQNLPTSFGAATVGLFIGQNIRDTDLDDPRQRTWWTFQNHMEHYVGGNTLSPTEQLPPPAPQWVYPFW
jgi:hypothetical protein